MAVAISFVLMPISAQYITSEPARDSSWFFYLAATEMVIGLFFRNGCADFHDGDGYSRYGDFDHVRSWVMRRCLIRLWLRKGQLWVLFCR